MPLWLAEPLLPLAAAVTVYGPPVVVAVVTFPVESTDPPPETLQVKDGCGVIALPPLSSAVAEYCRSRSLL